MGPPAAAFVGLMSENANGMGDGRSRGMHGFLSELVIKVHAWASCQNWQ